MENTDKLKNRLQEYKVNWEKAKKHLEGKSTHEITDIAATAISMLAPRVTENYDGDALTGLIMLSELLDELLPKLAVSSLLSQLKNNVGNDETNEVADNEIPVSEIQH
jgi:hypothetical protein